MSQTICDKVTELAKRFRHIGCVGKLLTVIRIFHFTLYNIHANYPQYREYVCNLKFSSLTSLKFRENATRTFPLAVNVTAKSRTTGPKPFESNS